jgi:MFS family permease
MTEITLQLRTDADGIEGHGYAQGYGWFNVAYSSGTLFGPLLAGWIVQTWNWNVQCYVMGSIAGVTIIPILLFTGGKRKGTA